MAAHIVKAQNKVDQARIAEAAALILTPEVRVTTTVLAQEVNVDGHCEKRGKRLGPMGVAKLGCSSERCPETMAQSEEDALFAKFSLKSLERELATAVKDEESRVAVRGTWVCPQETLRIPCVIVRACPLRCRWTK